MTYDIKIDEQNRIITPNGGNWFADTTVGNWIFGVEYAGDFNPYREDGHYLYKYESGQVQERTDEEKETDDPMPPTREEILQQTLDQLRADADYLEMENESLTAEAEQSRADVDYCMMLLGEEVE